MSTTPSSNVQARRLARDLLGIAESAKNRARRANAEHVCALKGGATPEEIRVWKRDYPYVDEREAQVKAITEHLETHLVEYLDPDSLQDESSERPLGQVVEDDHGQQWVHFGNEMFIKTVPNAGLRTASYSELANPRVLP